MKIHYIYYFLFLLVVSFKVHSQEFMTLPKAISIGLENNYQIKIADKFIEIADNNNSWARAGRVPTVDLNGSFTNSLTKDNNPASFLQGTFYNGSLGGNVSANYTLYSGGRIRINKEQLNLAVTQQELNKNTDIHQLLRDIYQQYYDVIFQQEQLAVLNQQLELSQDRLEYEKIRRDYGASNSFNILQFESGVLTDTNAIVQQTQLIETAKRTLYNTLNISETDFVFDERLSITPEEIDLAKLQDVMQEENYTLKSLEMLAQINRLNTGLARAANRPTIGLNGSVGFAENAFKFFADDPNTGEPFDLLFSNRFTANLGVQLSYNLYDGGVRSDDIQNAQLQEEIDQLSILDVQSELKRQLEILVDNYNNQLQLLVLADQQIQVSRQNLEITEERFKSGQISSIDFRNVQNQYLNAAFSKVGAIYSLLLTKSEIDFLVGEFS